MNFIAEKSQFPTVISEDALDANMEWITASLNRMCKEYKKGFLTEQELRQNIFCTVVDGFYAFLGISGRPNKYAVEPSLSFDLSNRSWQRFLEDHKMWTAGKLPQSAEGEPYLCYKFQNLKKGIKKGEEAFPLDKAQFFKLMEFLMISPEFFEPIPETCPVPYRNVTTYGTGDVWNIEFLCADDDVFRFAGSEAIGRKVVLVDRYGLHAELEIKDVLEKWESGFEAFGTIEGITSSRKRKIDVILYENLCVDLRVFVEQDDREVFSNYPLWQEYWAHQEKKEKLLNAILDALKKPVLEKLKL